MAGKLFLPVIFLFRQMRHPPKALSQSEIKQVIADFAESAKRAVKAGFDLIELHAAHGYLLHQFMSPLSNKRDDQYGGSLENRIRLTLEVLQAMKAAVPRRLSNWSTYFGQRLDGSAR